MNWQTSRRGGKKYHKRKGERAAGESERAYRGNGKSDIRIRGGGVLIKCARQRGKQRRKGQKFTTSHMGLKGRKKENGVGGGEMSWGRAKAGKGKGVNEGDSGSWGREENQSENLNLRIGDRKASTRLVP